MHPNDLPTLIVMGVSGSGKSTIGADLCEALGLEFVDGDSLHPQANIEKMSRGIPLTDDDRWPWLRTIGDTVRHARDEGRTIIVACSSLKRAYRDVLREPDEHTIFIECSGDFDTLDDRMSHREGHFMPASLLRTQLEALEPLGADEVHVSLDITKPPSVLTGLALSFLRRRYPDLVTPADGELLR